MSGFEAVNGDFVFSQADPDSEVLVGPVDDFIGTVVRSLEGRLPLITPDEDVFGLLENARYVSPNVVVSTRGDRTEIADFFSQLSKMHVDWS